MPSRSFDGEGKVISKVINTDNWKNKKYIVWVMCTALVFVGYYTPYIHVVQFVKDNMPENNGAILLSCIPITSCIFRYVTYIPGVVVSKLVLWTLSTIKILSIDFYHQIKSKPSLDINMRYGHFYAKTLSFYHPPPLNFHNRTDITKLHLTK